MLLDARSNNLICVWLTAQHTKIRALLSGKVRRQFQSGALFFFGCSLSLWEFSQPSSFLRFPPVFFSIDMAYSSTICVTMSREPAGGLSPFATSSE
jgi:hypothetical protein